MKGKLYPLLMVLCLALASVAVTGTAFAGPQGRSPVATKANLNEVGDVKVEQRKDGTYITISGSRQATYSVFKLQRPLRLFVDISNSQLGDGVKRAPVTVRNGIVDQVAVMDFSDDVQQVTRVIVGFENASTYDVRVQGTDIVVFIEGAGNGQGPVAGDAVQEKLRQREAELGRARDALQSKEQNLADSERKVSALEKALRESRSGESRNVLQRALDQERDRASTLRRDLAERDNRIENLQGQVQSSEQRASSLEQQARQAKKRSDELARERDQARRDAKAYEKRTADARRELERMEKRLSGAEKNLKANDKRSGQAAREADALRSELEAMRADVARRDREAKEARQELAQLKAQGSGDAGQAKKSRELQALEAKLAKINRQIESKQSKLQKSERQAQNQKAEQDRARKAAQQAQRERDAQMARAQKAEQERLAALELARRKEQERLATIERERKLQEEKLTSLKQTREQEEARVAALQKTAERREARGPAAAESRLVTVSENKDEAVVELKKDTKSAVVETANSIKAVRFQQKGAVSRIIIDLEQPGKFETVPWDSGKAALILKKTTLPKRLQRTLDTQAFGGTVRTISSFQDKDGLVKVVADVPGATTEIVRQDGAQLVWEFTSVGVTPGAAAPGTTAAAAPEGNFTSAPPSYVPGASNRSANANQAPAWQRRPRGVSRKRIDIDLRGADVQNVLRLIAREASLNIIAGNNVRGKVTMRLKNVLLADAFITILKSLNLGYERDGEVLRVGPAASFEKEAARRRKALVDDFPLEPLEIVLMPVNYANAASVRSLVATVLSSRGQASVDPRTNTIVVKDIAQNLAAAQQLILSLDTQTPQVLIEARIVETNDQFRRQFGIQWGGDFLYAPANGNPTGLLFPGALGVQGAATDALTPTGGVGGQPNFAVNLPAPIGTGSGGGIGVTLGSLGNGANLALRLSALEDEGQVKIVSSPKIMTLDNESATITQGTSIPVSVVSAAGVQTQFIEANLSLQVTPHVTQDGNVLMSLNITKSEPDFENTGARGDPSILRRSADTRLLVGDGDTTVIGGIYSQTTGNSTSKVPFLGDIPLLGYFFRNYSENELRTELLIFITPRIVNREAALRAKRLNSISNPNAASGN